MFSCESRVTLTVSGRTRAVQETKFTLGQDLRLAKQSRKHFVVSKSNGRNWALSTSCSGSFETDLFTLSLKHLTWTDRHVYSFYSCSYNSCILVFRIDFRPFASLRRFVIHSATEDCKVVLLPLFQGLAFPSWESKTEMISVTAVYWSASYEIIQPVSMSVKSKRGYRLAKMRNTHAK